jgi:hypothetical protein
MLNACIIEGPQLVTRCGMETAVLVPIQLWVHLHPEDYPSLKELLLAPEPRTDSLVPERTKYPSRPPNLLMID